MAHYIDLAPTDPTLLDRWRSARDAVRARRAARRDAQQRRVELERQLATYTTPAETDEILALLRGHEGEDVEMMRTIVTDNRDGHVSGPRYAALV